MQQEVPSDALKDETVIPATVKGDDLNHINEKAYDTLILCLGDKALRDVARETSTKAI